MTSLPECMADHSQSLANLLVFLMFKLTNGIPQMAKLILALAYADTEVKASMCNVTTIQNLFSAIEQASEQLQLITLSAVKRLSTDPMMLPHLEVCLSHHS